MPEERLIPIKEVRKLVPYGKTSIMQMVAANSFPRPISLSSRKLAWRASDIQKWIAAKAA